MDHSGGNIPNYRRERPLAEEAPKIAHTAKTLAIASKLSDRSQWIKLPQSSSLGLLLPVAPNGSFRGRRRASCVKRSTRRGSRCINPRNLSSDAAKKRSSIAATNEQRSQKKDPPRRTYRTLPACYPRHRHRRTKKRRPIQFILARPTLTDHSEGDHTSLSPQ